MTHQELQTDLEATATKIAGDSASELVTADWTSLLMQYLMQFLDSCLGQPAPDPSPSDPAGAAPPVTPATIASRMKNMSGLEQAALHGRSKRFYRKNGMTARHGKLAADTIIATSKEKTEDQLTSAVSTMQGVNDSFPQVEMF